MRLIAKVGLILRQCSLDAADRDRRRSDSSGLGYHQKHAGCDYSSSSSSSSSEDGGRGEKKREKEEKKKGKENVPNRAAFAERKGEGGREVTLPWRIFSHGTK